MTAVEKPPRWRVDTEGVRQHLKDDVPLSVR
jgi:hypothetical protein